MYVTTFINGFNGYFCEYKLLFTGGIDYTPLANNQGRREVIDIEGEGGDQML